MPLTNGGDQKCITLDQRNSSKILSAALLLILYGNGDAANTH